MKVDDFHIENTGEETLFISLSIGAVKWARALQGPFRQFLDEPTSAFIFPLPGHQAKAEEFRGHLKGAGFQIREL